MGTRHAGTSRRPAVEQFTQRVFGLPSKLFFPKHAKCLQDLRCLQRSAAGSASPGGPLTRGRAVPLAVASAGSCWSHPRCRRTPRPWRRPCSRAWTPTCPATRPSRRARPAPTTAQGHLSTSRSTTSPRLRCRSRPQVDLFLAVRRLVFGAGVEALFGPDAALAGADAGGAGGGAPHGEGRERRARRVARESELEEVFHRCGRWGHSGCGVCPSGGAPPCHCEQYANEVRQGSCACLPSCRPLRHTQ